MSSDILVPSSQDDELSSEPPRKRRRITRAVSSPDDRSVSDQSQDSIDLPSHDVEDYIEIDDDILGIHRSKYEAVMHEPAYVDSQKNVFVSQVDQPWSSPTRIRGPRWRKKSLSPSSSPESILPVVRQTTSGRGRDILLADEFDDDELEALMVGQEFEKPDEVRTTTNMRPQLVQQQSGQNMRQTTLFGINTTQRERPVPATQGRPHNWRLAERVESPTHHKIDQKSMEKWIFPLNVGTIREYQYNIVHKALFNNILVALPTGLGKTFIAATVMMNWFNWTGDAQIVFMAPTKPLVAQQIDACFHIAGIPRSQTTLMTGEIPVAVRADEWQTKRVFFMTPQTLENDLKTGIADPKRIVLLVVDEAHKATGSYAYVKVVQFLRRFNNSFRVLALTATPGSTVEAVQKVIDGLGIARVEIRTEDSIDIRGFVHDRNTELELFNYSDEINMCMDLFSKAVQPVVDKLCSQNAFWGKDPLMMTLFGLMQARKQWFASETGKKATPGLKGMIHACFTPLMSLAHNLELLKFHGIGPFYSKMKTFQDTASGNGKYAKMILESEHFMTLMNRVRGWIRDDGFVGHPKLEYLNQVVLNHFLDAGEGVGRATGHPPSDTRIMIFAHYRDSAEEICRVLNRHQPMVRAHVFVGQSDTKASAGMDQKTQTEMIKKFKAGTFNTLVATSIGEEGLDIGEVDLIVCYDCSKSPIRMLQRMGRTGRKRAGNIVMLLMRGKEERDYHSAKDNYQKMQEIIESGREFSFHHDISPRIVPKGVEPVVSKEVVQIPYENTQAEASSVEPKKSRGRPKKRPAKKFHMPDGVETGFQFLGRKKARQQSAETKTRRRKRVYLDDDEATLPNDSSILLTTNQEIELENRYAFVMGDEPQFVPVIQVGNQPGKLRRQDKTSLVSHSKSTVRLIKGLASVITSVRYDARPSKPPLVSKNSKTPDGSEDSAKEFGVHETCEVPFYVSQQVPSPSEGSQNDVLEDLDNLFKRPRPTTSDDGANKAVNRQRRRPVISDDDDNDDEKDE
ncbi:3'-5' DNA helicase [Neophaeococcomyces mojaviensis]|uniref:3'-5' DNA helicase n=1 Tax=Neophaeococcomyces mojaviensis TaxID=3383035 RepID=A0ACC3AEW3_9EURO|nr:3'-5' DNA helicase [Knufia sp. JES_112]